MYGYGYPGICCGYGGNWFWIIIIVLIIFFILFWHNDNDRCHSRRSHDF